MTFARRRNRLMTNFSKRIPVVQRRMAVLFGVMAGIFVGLFRR